MRITALAVLCSAAACGSPAEGPEARLRAWVDAMHEAAEAKDRRALVSRISPAYSDARGNARDDVENLLRLYFLRQDRIEVIPKIDAIRVIDGTAAEIALTVGMAGTDNSAFGISADAYRFELELEADDDDWQLISARWGELGEAPR